MQKELTIKNATILRNTYFDKDEMQNDLLVFLVNYMLYRKHGSVRKELGVKTPFNAIEKIISLSKSYQELLK